MNIKNCKILLTGATGFIGKSLCQALIEKGATLVVLTRDEAAARKILNKSEIRFIKKLSDLDNRSVIDGVINLAGETISQRWTEGTKKRIYDSRVKLTADLANFIISLKAPPRFFISGSAIGFYGCSGQQAFSDTMPSASDADKMFTHHLCCQWEEATEIVKKAGIRTVLLRTGVVFEKDGGIIKKMFPAFRLGLGGRIGDGRQWLSWIHRKDLIGLIMHSIEDISISGPLNATAPAAVTNKEFTIAFARALKRPAFFPVPTFVLEAAFGQMAREIMLSGQRVIPEKAIHTGYKFLYPTINKAFDDIFLSLKTS
jgi:uncharacterized protein (TIGR01777 family)